MPNVRAEERKLRIGLSNKRGVIEETGYPSYKTVASCTFWVHEYCNELGIENAKQKFEEDWKAICNFIDSDNVEEERYSG